MLLLLDMIGARGRLTRWHALLSCARPQRGGYIPPAYQPRAQIQQPPAFSPGAPLRWHQWFVALDQGAEAVRKEIRRGFALIPWNTLESSGWF